MQGFGGDPLLPPLMYRYLCMVKNHSNYMDIHFSEIELNIMKVIKSVFDPYNIMNPSKIF